jgi:hypothetical protein
MRIRLSATPLFLFFLPFVLVPSANAQQEGPISTQTLVEVDSKSPQPVTASDLTIAINNHKEPLTALAPVLPTGAQVVLLIDDGLRESVGRELPTLKAFVQKLPHGIEIFIGYMQNGRVVTVQPFTTDHTAAAAAFRLPEGIPGASASPYFCLSDFVKKWPGVEDAEASTARKARFVLLLSNGVDPYNGSTSPLNQDSPYVSSAIEDSQRAGVAVYSIYYGDAGIRGGSASFSGQSYLAQLGEGTGGANYYEGSGNPVSIAPYLAQFQHAIAETYVATFNAPAVKERDFVRIKLTTSEPKTKIHAPEQVHPGNRESAVQ